MGAIGNITVSQPNRKAGGGGGVESVAADEGLIVDVTDPLNPVVKMGSADPDGSASFSTDRYISDNNNNLFFVDPSFVQGTRINNDEIYFGNLDGSFPVLTLQKSAVNMVDVSGNDSMQLTASDLSLSEGGGNNVATLTGTHILFNGFGFADTGEMTEEILEFVDGNDSSVLSSLTKQALQISDGPGGHTMGATASEVALGDGTNTAAMLAFEVVLTDGAGGDSNTMQATNTTIADASGNSVIINSSSVEVNGVNVMAILTAGSLQIINSATTRNANYSADRMQLSDALSSSVTHFDKFSGYINAPSASGNLATLDIYGDFTTDDPLSPGSLGGAIKFGNIVAGAVVLDTTRYVAGSVGGAFVKFLIAA